MSLLLVTILSMAVFLGILTFEDTKRDIKTGTHNLVIMMYGLMCLTVYTILLFIDPMLIASHSEKDSILVMFIVATITTFIVDKIILLSKHQRRIIICTIIYASLYCYLLYRSLMSAL